MQSTHDVIVIGAGAAGLTAAGGRVRAGLRVALLERDRMGGECLNTGCVPNKALLAATRRAHGMRGDGMGVRGAGPQVDFAGVRAHVRAAIDATAPHDSAARFKVWGAEVIQGSGHFTGRTTLDVNGRTFGAPRNVIATGSRPRIPPIEGLATVPYIANETVFDLAQLPRRLIVLGGGAIGIELAQAFRRLGSEVVVVEAQKCLATSDPAAAAIVLDRLRAERVEIRDAASMRTVRAAGELVRLELGQGGAIEGSHLLIAAGREPDVAGLDLQAAGIETDDDGIRVVASRRTTNPRVYAIGDCRAGPRLTHAAGYEGGVVVAAIAFGLSRPADFA